MRRFIVIPILLLFLFGCAPAVSQEQYNSLQSELKTTQEQLAATKAELESMKSQIASTKDPLAMPAQTWSSMKPYCDFAILVFENMETYQLKDAEKINAMDLNMKTMDQSERLKDILKKIDNQEFVSKVQFGWYDSKGKDKSAAWADIWNFLRTKLQDDMNKMNSQLNP